jgi:hypothetical protein
VLTVELLFALAGKLLEGSEPGDTLLAGTELVVIVELIAKVELVATTELTGLDDELLDEPLPPESPPQADNTSARPKATSEWIFIMRSLIVIFRPINTGKTTSPECRRRPLVLIR